MRHFYLGGLLLFAFATDGICAKAGKDFKGMFGSYRRNQFVENEGNATDFGINLMLSTLLPMSSVVSSSGGSPAISSDTLHYATSFNLEVEFHLSIAYHWQTYLRVGYIDYDTRRENPTSGNESRFHEFSLRALPLIGGLKFRFGRDDLVPYIGIGAGVSYVERRAYFDYSNADQRLFGTVLTFEGVVGIEYYFASRVGVRLEISGYYMKLDPISFSAGPSFPTFEFKSSPFFFAVCQRNFHSLLIFAPKPTDYIA